MRTALLALSLGALASTAPVDGAPFLAEYLGTGYLAPFVVLVLCGFGLPIPEEITMLGAGFLAHRGEVDFVPVVLVCMAATLIGDSIPYSVGRRFGRQALRSRAVRRALHPERLRSIERRFERSGLWAIFICRFLPGVRLPAWFTAGTLGIPYHRFIAVDALGAALMTPAFVALGRYSGEKIAELEGRVEGLTQILGFIAVALVVGMAIRMIVSHKPRRGLGGGRPRTAPAPGTPPTAGAASPTPPPPAPPPPGNPGQGNRVPDAPRRDNPGRDNPGAPT
ncbi:MAG: DedA family protein [Planctomycetota bacterium]